MADLPQLPERVRRKFALQWDELVEKHGFTGEHLNWPQTRRRKIVTGKMVPPSTAGDRTVHFIQQRTEPPAPVYAPVDTIGISESGLLGVERYTQVGGEYFSLWLAGPARRSDVFTAWLVELRAVVAGEVAELWKERGDWFQRVCRASLDKGLTPIFDEMKRKAREIEIADLAAENTPFEEVMERAREAIEGADKLLAERAKLRRGQPPNGPPAVSELSVQEPAAGSGKTGKAPRRLLEPRPDLLTNPDATLSRFRAADALGITPRTLDRWVTDGKLTRVGAGLRKRFKVKELKRVLDQRLLDKGNKK
jgi:transposase InsO family protein